MAKFDIDNILNQLGVTPDDPAVPRAKSKASLPEAPERHKPGVDSAEQSFCPLPSVPSGQRSFNESVTVDNDPAVPVKPKATPKSGVGEAFSTVYQPESTDALAVTSDPAQFLLGRNDITPQQLTAAQQVLRQAPGRRLTEVLIEQGADEVLVQTAVAALACVPFERIDLSKGLDGGFDGRLLQRLTCDFCKEHLVLPLRIESASVPVGGGGGRHNQLAPISGGGGGRLVIGGTRPEDVFVLDEVRRRLGITNLKLVVVAPSDIKAALDIVGAATATPEAAEDINALLADVEETDVEVEKNAAKSDETDLEQQAGESPVIRYVNHIIQTAVREGASDIHIEPCEKRVKVRFRIDGVLFEMMTPPASMSAAITSRLKIMGNLDIAERRVPQDGRIRCTVQGRKLDLRMSTLPSTYGEKVVMRILDTRSINVHLEDLGFDEATLAIWRKAIDEPHGIVLVTGPTGSGKTTTLYASIKQLDKTSMNISTVEDPVEYHLEGITQTQTHEKIGMTFPKALKALLRQDPDVIMLGEIRDLDTAHTAIQAALTGHLVLSTLHTNDAPSSITRLINIGLEPFLIGAAVRAVLAQRLVRKLCAHCKHQAPCSEERAEFLALQGMDPTTVWTPKGCEKCRNTGYSGRVGIYELLTVDDSLRDIIARNPNVSEFRRLCMERGMNTLRQDGMAKAAAGKTSVEEILRVTEANA